MKRTRNTVAKQIFACGNSIHKVAFSAVMIQLYVQAAVLHQYSKIKKKVQMIIMSILWRIFNNIPNISAFSNLRKYEACQLPVLGAVGLTVIFTQTDHTANFTTTQRTISDFNLGSVAGGMLILFLNSMKKSHVSITNTKSMLEA